MTDSTTQSLSGALERLRNGDRDAFAELFERHRSRLFHIVNLRLDRRMKGRVDADDILQEVYIDAADRIDVFVNRHSGSLFVWLRLIATQTMANVFRRHLDTEMRDAKRDVSLQMRRSYDSASAPLAIQLLGKLTTPSQAAMREESAEQLEMAIQSMKSLDRDVITLRHFEQLDNSEVAEVLGIQPKAASIRYIRAIRRLKKLLADAPWAIGDEDHAR